MTANQTQQKSQGLFRPLFRHPFIAGGSVLFVLFVVYALTPKPVAVDIGHATRGPLEESVREDGRTRVIQRYVVSAPLAGTLSRIDLRPGDPVEANQTVLAEIAPAHPALLDERSRAEAKARLEAAKANRIGAEAGRERAEAAVEFARNQFARAQELAASQVVAQDELDEARERVKTAEAELRQARSAVEVARFEVAQAEAALLWEGPGTDAEKQENFQIRPPVDGAVLRLFEESATPVTPGQALLELGDPREIEVEIDVLSPDAVRIRPGARVFLEHWGENEPLRGLVRKVEPAAFTKISALGVEEQRVWIIVDLVSPPEERPALGDAYRVEARIVTWEADDVLRIPSGALFRSQGAWSVFVVENDQARLREITIGHSSGLEVEVKEGLRENEMVILHPGDRISDGVKVEQRE